jgi:DNA-binding PadR family transcriptional regulator
MLIPLYILGLLSRAGPQHGYQLKKLFEEQLSDFTQIKLPTVYYHLEKMEKDGLLSASREKSQNGQDKTIYSITEKGTGEFPLLLERFLEFHYRPTFETDAVFYFSDRIDRSAILESLERHGKKVRAALDAIAGHKRESQLFLPEEAKKMALVIFDHHERHYWAELDWTRETLDSLAQRK